MREILFSVLVATTLGACGGSGADAPAVAAHEPAAAPVPASTASAPIPSPASTPVVKIAVFGDDEVSGIAITPSGMPSLITPSEQDNLQSDLQESFGDTGITVTNAATGGTSSSLQNEMDGMDGGGSAEPQRMIASGARIIIQEHMLNDALAGETANQYAGYLMEWIEAAKGAGLTPVLEESGPVCDGNHPFLQNYVTSMNNIAANYGVPIIHQYDAILQLPDWRAHMIKCLYPDGYLLKFKALRQAATLAPLIANETK